MYLKECLLVPLFLVVTIGQCLGNIYIPRFNQILPGRIVPATYFPAYMWQGRPMGYASLPKVYTNDEVTSTFYHDSLEGPSSDVKQTEISPTSYMIIAHCAKALSTVHALFRDFDINVDTKISKVEFDIGIQRLKSRLSYTLPWINFMAFRMSDGDANQDFTLSFEEFKTWHSSFIDRVIFKFYDTNGDGFIDKQEYIQEFTDQSTAPILSLEEFDISGMVDSNGMEGPDGKIDYDEFIKAARKIPGIHQKFPGISEFMSSFLDMFCSESY